ncbi:AAA family ATPase [Rhodobacter capsulatus]|uniref:AAA family ATPase n=1 Tax=Rhodobacter capsulatus TaxID=1061 RepID=UPI0040253609
MNAQVKQPVWEDPKGTPNIADADLRARWEAATRGLREVATTEGWSKSEVARRAEMPLGTLSAWYDGTYAGRYDTTTQRVENFLSSRAAAIETMRGLPVAPDWMQTRIARELVTAFTYAQMVPTMAVITVASGLGKSMTARTYAATRPHVVHVELSPSSASPHTMKYEIAEAMGIECKDGGKLKGMIAAALRRDGHHALLIVDEAQNLSEPSINELRHFRDVAGCGLVLLGNEEGRTPYASRDPRHSSAQVARRIGHRLSVMKPYDEDIAQFVDAWGLSDPEAVALAHKIGRMPGAFGTLSETIMVAGIIAAGNDREITAADLRAAWANRGAGVLK